MLTSSSSKSNAEAVEALKANPQSSWNKKAKTAAAAHLPQAPSVQQQWWW
jgi:hypothetical protein